MPGAEPLEQPDELARLAVDVAAGQVQVERQHPPGARARVVHRDCRRLARGVCGQRPRMPGRVGAAAVTGDPDVRSARDRGRDGMPGVPRGGAREAVRAGRVLSIGTRRVARGQC